VFSCARSRTPTYRPDTAARQQEAVCPAHNSHAKVVDVQHGAQMTRNYGTIEGPGGDGKHHRRLKPKAADDCV